MTGNEIVDYRENMDLWIQLGNKVYPFRRYTLMASDDPLSTLEIILAEAKDAIAQAVAAEREDCAEVAEAHECRHPSTCSCCYRIAEAIRARTTP